MGSLYQRISHARVLIDTTTAMLAQVQLHRRFYYSEHPSNASKDDKSEADFFE